MALQRLTKKKFKSVELKSGRFYTFRYKAWENDPKPTIIFMYWFAGTHPNTGRQWRFFQAINFSYIKKSIRKRFMRLWLEELNRSKNIDFTWRKVISRYPWLKKAVRRYFYSPSYYIIGNSLKEIPLNKAEKAIVSTYSKDFSKKIRTTIMKKFRRKKKEKR